MTRPLRETLDEARNILVVFRDALLGAQMTTSTPSGTARLVLFRDDKVDLLVRRAAAVGNELSEHIGRIDRQPDPEKQP